MKELKFRIWIKDEKRYYDESDEESYMIVPNGNVTYTSEAYEEYGVWFNDTTNATNGVIVEQYTGLKDKNGKEIYEGDLVEYTTCYYGNEKRHRKVVEWSEWDSDDFGEPHNLGYSNLSECMEVIGNVHENANLLEKK